MSVRSRGGSGEAVAAAGGVGFPSLTALRRSDLLVVFQVHRRTSVHVPSLAFIERLDRGPLPRKKEDAPDQGGSGSMEGDPDSV
jgi:hypothetical protein